MFDMQQQDDSGVSPVIGVILMVAVTVALVALVTVVVFDLGGDVSDSPDATVQLEQGTNSTGNNQVTATLLRNENVDELYIQAPDGTQGTTPNMTDAGDTTSITNLDAGSNNDAVTDLSDGDSINVIAKMPDGSEEVLTSTEYSP
jgi:flagellin-like protein